MLNSGIVLRTCNSVQDGTVSMWHTAVSIAAPRMLSLFLYSTITAGG